MTGRGGHIAVGGDLTGRECHEHRHHVAGAGIHRTGRSPRPETGGFDPAQLGPQLEHDVEPHLDVA